LTEESKNLAEVTRQEQAQREGTPQFSEVRGKIIELLWQLEKDGRKEGTIHNYDKWLSHMLKNGVNLYDPESIKGFLAKSHLKDSTKVLVAAICDVWLTFLKIPWRPPKYSADHEIPFIPTEQELDLLIAACGKKVATFLQILKETGARCGEITKLTWTSIDSQQKVVRITAEKGSLSRILPLSTKAIEMLNNLPRDSERIFVFADDMRSNFHLQRKRIARKLGNPRLLQIHFHTFRHWKGTMEYHKTKDPIYVKEILGHKDLKSTQVYIHISHALFQNTPPEDFHAKVATTPDEITQLLEAGFEYVLQKDNLAYFRKRK
jgi:integrase